MSHLRPYKFIVQAIPQIVDEDDNVTGEENGVQPVALFGCDALAEWAADFPAKLAASEAAQTPEEPKPNRAQHRSK